MSQYTKIFGTCRIPGIKKDTLEYNPTSDYIIVVRNNNVCFIIVIKFSLNNNTFQYFKVQVLDEYNKKFSEKQLTEQFENVLKNSEQVAPEIGVLTTDKRDNWGKAYEELIKDPTNKSSVREIQKSLFLVCFDKALAISKTERPQNVASHQTIHGGGSSGNAANRWFDKTVQVCNFFLFNSW